VVPCNGPNQLRALDSCSSARLPTSHPEIAMEFEAGNFMIQNTCRQFSAILIDQANEQNNAAIKGDNVAMDDGRTKDW